MKAYHFHNGTTLWDGQLLPPLGAKLVFKGHPILCEQGLHFSLHPFDALKYAPGNFLDIVEVGGVVVMGDDKGVCTERTRIKAIDAAKLLQTAARMFATDVLHLWKKPAPREVRGFLLTGNETKRAAARAAAWAATRDAAWAARNAAWAATGDAAWAAWNAARDAEGAMGAVRVARDAAWDAAQNKQRAQFLALVEAAFKGE
jgi:hypothetical protein